MSSSPPCLRAAHCSVFLVAPAISSISWWSGAKMRVAYLRPAHALGLSLAQQESSMQERSLPTGAVLAAPQLARAVMHVRGVSRRSIHGQAVCMRACAVFVHPNGLPCPEVLCNSPGRGCKEGAQGGSDRHTPEMLWPRPCSVSDRFFRSSSPASAGRISAPLSDVASPATMPHLIRLTTTCAIAKHLSFLRAHQSTITRNTDRAAPPGTLELLMTPEELGAFSTL